MVLRSTSHKAGRAGSGGVKIGGSSSKSIVQHDSEVPGTSETAAANLLMADIVMRIGSSALRHFVESRLLKGRYGPDTARRVMRERSVGKALTSIAVAKIATRSVPGAAIVGTGILAKTLYERGKARRDAEQGDQGDQRADKSR